MDILLATASSDARGYVRARRSAPAWFSLSTCLDLGISSRAIFEWELYAHGPGPDDSKSLDACLSLASKPWQVDALMLWSCCHGRPDGRTPPRLGEHLRLALASRNLPVARSLLRWARLAACGIDSNVDLIADEAFGARDVGVCRALASHSGELAAAVVAVARAGCVTDAAAREFASAVLAAVLRYASSDDRCALHCVDVVQAACMTWRDDDLLHLSGHLSEHCRRVIKVVVAALEGCHPEQWGHMVAFLCGDQGRRLLLLEHILCRKPSVLIACPLRFFLQAAEQLLAPKDYVAPTSVAQRLADSFAAVACKRAASHAPLLLIAARNGHVRCVDTILRVGHLSHAAIGEAFVEAVRSGRAGVVDSLRTSASSVVAAADMGSLRRVFIGRA
jgi:hypothetical protein